MNEVSVLDIFRLSIHLQEAIHGEFDDTHNAEAMDCEHCNLLAAQLAEWASAHDAMVPRPEDSVDG